MLSDFRAVYVDIGIVVYTVKVQNYGFSAIACGKYDVFTVPARTARQESGFGFIVVGKFLCDAEIMRNLNVFPGRIVVIFSSCVYLLCFVE